MENLEFYRKEIDKIDAELISLIEKRMDVAKNIARFKLKNGMQVLDSTREKQVLASRVDRVSQKEYESVIEKFFIEVMALSRGVQQNLIDSHSMKKFFTGKAVYQGVDGAYGSIAASKIFGENIYNVKTFENVFEEVAGGNADYGVLPLENSTTGSITDVVDMLSKYDVFIVGETFVKVEHNLLVQKGASLSDIKEVYSHEQGFWQCKDYLKGKDWVLNTVVNTAVGAKIVSESGDKTKAAIASYRACQLYDLEVKESCINSGKENYTRFIVIAKEPQIGENFTKTAVSFSVPHVSGSLMSALQIFAENSVNLAKLESRPVIDRIGEYLFFAELEGNINDDNMKNALNSLKKYATSYKYLGNYKKI
ncbi:MAG: chorismate mutase [Clostridia bacterium]